MDKFFCILHFVTIVFLFYGAGTYRTVKRVDSLKCYCDLVCGGGDTSNTVSLHIKWQACIYTRWVQLASQESLSL